METSENGERGLERVQTLEMVLERRANMKVSSRCVALFRQVESKTCQKCNR